MSFRSALCGGTAQYNTGTRTGFPNIEFEQVLFYDIMNSSSSASGMGSEAPQAVVIDAITNNNTTYPKVFADFTNDANNNNKYYYFLNLFSTSNCK